MANRISATRSDRRTTSPPHLPRLRFSVRRATIVAPPPPTDADSWKPRPMPRTLPVPAAAALVLIAVLALQATALHAMGQPTICTCGILRPWQGDVLGPENSQQLTDWYTFSHVLHGMIFYAGLRIFAPRLPLLAALGLALGIECAWELLENSPAVIDRYRAQALAQGYSGDSIVNSLSDTCAATLGFVLARTLPTRWSIGFAVAAELFTGAMIHDNLTLNVIQLVHPVDAIAAWQTGRDDR